MTEVARGGKGPIALAPGKGCSIAIIDGPAQGILLGPELIFPMPRIANQQLNGAQKARRPVGEQAGELAILHLQIGDGENLFILAAQEDVLDGAGDGDRLRRNDDSQNQES